MSHALGVLTVLMFAGTVIVEVFFGIALWIAVGVVGLGISLIGLFVHLIRKEEA